MRFQRGKKGKRFVRWVIVFLFLGLTLWVYGLFIFASTIPSIKKIPSDVRTDAIVVLTGGSGRLERALDLLEKGHANLLFVSGVYVGLDVRRLLQAIKKEDYAIENRISIGNAVDTHENATESSEWAQVKGITSLRLVTAGYHMPRSLMEFRNALSDTIKIVPHPVFPDHVKQDMWWSWPGTALLIIGEYNKYLIGWVRLSLQMLYNKVPKNS